MPNLTKKPTGKKKIIVKKIVKKVVETSSVSSEEEDTMSDVQETPVLEKEEVLSEKEEVLSEQEEEVLSEKEEEILSEKEEVMKEEDKTLEKLIESKVEDKVKNWDGFTHKLYDILRSDCMITGKPAFFEIINILFLVIMENKHEVLNQHVKTPLLKLTDEDKFSKIYLDTKNKLKEVQDVLSKKHPEHEKLLNEMKDHRREENKVYADLWSRLYNQKKHLNEKIENGQHITTMEPGETIATFVKYGKNPFLGKIILLLDNISIDINSQLPIDKITRFHVLDKIDVFTFDGKINSKYAHNPNSADEPALPVKFGKIIFKLMDLIFKAFYVEHQGIYHNCFIKINDKFDTFGAAFEEMMSDTKDTNAKKLGEYFTRRDVIRIILNEVKPKIGQKICDFAAGTGGFFQEIIHYFKHNEEGKKMYQSKEELKEYFSKCIYGNECDPETFKLLCCNILLHDEEGRMLENLIKIDSLDLMCSRTFTQKNKDLINSIDVGVGNPPYGPGDERDKYQIDKINHQVEKVSKHNKKYEKISDGFTPFWGPLDKGQSMIKTSMSCQFMIMRQQKYKA